MYNKYCNIDKCIISTETQIKNSEFSKTLCKFGACDFSRGLLNCHFKNENEIFACSRPISVSGKLGNVRKSYIFHYTSSEICASHKGLLFFVRYYTGILTVSALCSLHLQAKLYVCTTSFIQNFLWLNGLLSERCLSAYVAQ